MICTTCDENVLRAVFGGIPDDIGIMKVGGMVKRLKFIARQADFVRVLVLTDRGITNHYLNYCDKCGYSLSEAIDENRRVDL